VNLRWPGALLITAWLAGGSALGREAVSKPCIVAIDVGHSPKAPGAVSARGVDEFVFNRSLANVLLQKIHRDGFAQAFIIDSTGMTLEQRSQSAKQGQADLLISIHHDSVQPRYLSSWTYDGAVHHYSDRFHGYSLFVSTKNPQRDASLSFAQRVGSHLLGAGFTPTLHHAEHIRGENRQLIDRRRGIYIFDDLIVLKTAAVPAVLLECGVIVNRKEEERLGNKANQQEMAEAVAAGIKEECEVLQRGSHPAKPIVPDRGPG